MARRFAELQIADLRRAIGLVSQDVFLFHGTVRENIAYGTFDATLDEIVSAAKIAEAHDFITRCLRAMTQLSASAVRNCPAGRASVYQSRAPCLRIRLC